MKRLVMTISLAIFFSSIGISEARDKDSFYLEPGASKSLAVGRMLVEIKNPKKGYGTYEIKDVSTQKLTRVSEINDEVPVTRTINGFDGDSIRLHCIKENQGRVIFVEITGE